MAGSAETRRIRDNVTRLSTAACGIAAALAVGLLGGAASGSPGLSGPPGGVCPPGAIFVPPGSAIQAAVDVAPPQATFCIGAGLHREQSVEPKSGQSFYGEPGSVLSGARLITRFVREGELRVIEGLVISRSPHGSCLDDRPACAYPEALFIDDEPLEQVLEQGGVGPGRFYVDRTKGRLYFQDDPEGRRVEVALADFAFFGEAEAVTITGLTVEKYANPAQQGAIQGENARGWTVADCEIRFNSGAGVSTGSDSRIEGNYIHSNGQLGVTAGGENIRVEHNEIARNNLYGFNPSWEAGGVKITDSRRLVIRGNHAHHNQGTGLWTDIDVHDVLFEDNLVEDNRDAGIFHEISYAAIIRNNVVRHNNRGGATWFWNAEIQIAASEGVEISGNDVTVGDEGHSIVLIDQNRGPDADGGLYRTARNRVHGNRITYEGTGGAGGVSDAEPGASNYGIIESGDNLFDGNEYRVPRGTEPARFVWGHEVFDFAGFRALGQEPNGRLILY